MAKRHGWEVVAVFGTQAFRAVTAEQQTPLAEFGERLNIKLEIVTLSLSQMSSGWRETANRVMLLPDVGRLQIAVVAARRVVPITSVT